MAINSALTDEPTRISVMDMAIDGPVADEPTRVSVMDMAIDCVTEREAIAAVITGLATRRGGRVITPNLDQLRMFHQAPSVRALYHDADLVLADGMPLVWASRLQGTPLPERVAGSSLTLSLTAEAARHGASVFLLGGDPGVAERAAAELAERYPGLRIAGTASPPRGFETDPDEMAGIVQALERTRPDITFIALGFPKQDWLARQLSDHFLETWFIGVGISLSFVAGELPRAPRWMQLAGLEWLHRLVHEPRRLASRYLVHDLPFGFRLLGHAVRSRAAAA